MKNKILRNTPSLTNSLQTISGLFLGDRRHLSTLRGICVIRPMIKKPFWGNVNIAIEPCDNAMVNCELLKNRRV